MKKILLPFFLVALFWEPLFAQDPNIPPSIPPSITQGDTKVKKPKMRYRTIGIGLSKPIGKFADDSFSGVFEESGGGRTGVLFELSKLRLFNATAAEHGTSVGLLTQFSSSINMVLYETPGENRDEPDPIFFGQLKLGPAITVVSSPKFVCDFSANLGYTLGKFDNLGYYYYGEKNDNFYRYETFYYGNTDNPFGGGITYGLSGNFRFGGLVLGAELNFLKVKITGITNSYTSIYERFSGSYVDSEYSEDIIEEHKYPASTFRLKLSYGW